MPLLNLPRANYPRQPDSLDLALAAIYEVLNHNGANGWSDWSRYAANGEW